MAHAAPRQSHPRRPHTRAHPHTHTLPHPNPHPHPPTHTHTRARTHLLCLLWSRSCVCRVCPAAAACAPPHAPCTAPWSRLHVCRRCRTYTHTHAHTHTRTRAHTHTHAHTYAHTCTHAHAHVSHRGSLLLSVRGLGASSRPSHLFPLACPFIASARPLMRRAAHTATHPPFTQLAGSTTSPPHPHPTPTSPPTPPRPPTASPAWHATHSVRMLSTSHSPPPAYTGVMWSACQASPSVA